MMNPFFGSAGLCIAMMLAKSTSIPPKAATMQRNNDAVVQMLKLPDTGYFQLAEEKRSGLLDDLILMDGFQGIALGGPAIVDVGNQDRLPLLWAKRAGNLRNWQVVAERNSTLIVSDLAAGRIAVQNAFAGPKKIDYRDLPKSGEGDPKDVVAPQGATAGCDILDARQIMNLPWRPGRYAISLVMFDWVANTLEVEFNRNGAAMTSAETDALAIPRAAAAEWEQKRQKAAKATYPAFAFAPTAKTPKLQGEGIALNVPDSFTGGTSPWLIHGAAHLKLSPGNLVQPPSPSSLAENADQTSPSVPDAILRMSLLLAQLDAPLRKIDVEIPVTGKGPFKAGDEVDVVFTVDIKAVLHSELPIAKYQVYAAGGNQIAGPYPLAISKR